ncbi:MAG TPA: AAA family ATPase, partial [Trebonia sp.]|nr:AAA family ATPase [Trebonia sp.]
MRPHRLRVTAFGAFAGTEEVRFDDLEGLFLLHGETGAGKTTLLDAIAFALYGKVPGERGKAKRLRSDHAPVDVRTEVRLEATVGGRRLRITRKPEQERPKRSGTGMTREQASVILEEATAAGEWEVKSTRVGEADAEILDLMGMSADQFFQVVLLPQGQFAQFLHAGADARADLLQKLFGTDRFRAVESWLADRRKATADRVRSAGTKVDELMARVSQVAGEPVPDPAALPAATPAPGTVRLPDAAQWQLTWTDGLMTAAEARLADRAAVLAARRASLDTALAAKTEAEQLAVRQRRRTENLGAQAALEADARAIAALRAAADAASRAAEVAPLLAAADRAAKAATDARRAEERAREAIPASHQTLRTASPDELRATGAEQQARLGRLDALRALAQQAASDENAAAVAQRRASQLATALENSQAEAAQRAAARDQSAASRDAAAEAVAALPAAQAALEARRQVADDSAKLVTQRAGRQRLYEAHLAAREKALGLREDANRLRAARIDGMRAELARNLVDGAPCPVCGSLDHPELCELTGEEVTRDREDAAYAAADAASAAADKAGQRVAAADAVIADLARRLTGAGFPPPGDDAALAAAARQASADAAALAAEAAELKARAELHTKLLRDVEALDQAIADAERKQVGFAEQRSAALAEAGGATQRAAAARQALRAQLGGAPDLETALSAARRLADALSAAAEAADTTARTAAEAGDARERAASTAADNGFAGPDPVRAAFRDPRWRKDAADRIKRHETETEATARRLADPDLDVPLDPPAPVAARAEAASQAQRDHDAAFDAHVQADQTAGQLRNLRPRLTDALTAMRPLKEEAERARQIADLAAGLPPNKYRMALSSFVLAARLEEVAAAASQRLLTMTGGRYTLVHTDARRGGGRAGLGLLACDAWTGQDRDTSTLSGGETFLASLALALGLADVVTQEAAGTPMEALFVDEGFGTLDEETLE